MKRPALSVFISCVLLSVGCSSTPKTEDKAPLARDEVPPKPVVDINPGKPVIYQGSEGLEITCTKPTFTRLTRVMARPENPLLKVTFNRSGVVDKVEVVESAGAPDVDVPIVAAVYLWTARGKPLDDLEANGTHTITVRILLR